MRPFLSRLFNAPTSIAQSAMSAVVRRQPAPARAGSAPDPFDRLPAMVAAERRREALRRMRATA